MAYPALLLCSLLIVSLSSVICIDEPGTASITHNIVWSANVSSSYPPSSPLAVRLGDSLNIECPADATSNIWIQNDLRQYEECDCNADGVEKPNCNATITTRQICQDEVHIKITFDSKNLNSALSFEPGTTYYLISYSPGIKPLDGYLRNSTGGECLSGYKMAMKVQPLEKPTTTGPPPDTTTNGDDNKDIFTKANTTTLETIATTKPELNKGDYKESPKVGGLNGTATELASSIVTCVSAVLVSLSFV